MVLTRWTDRDPFAQYLKALEYDWSETNIQPILAWHGKQELDEPGERVPWETWDLRGKTNGNFPTFQRAVFQRALDNGSRWDWICLIDDDAYYRDPAQVDLRIRQATEQGFGAWGPIMPFTEGFMFANGKHDRECEEFHPLGRNWATYGTQFYSREMLETTRGCWEQDLLEVGFRADMYQYLLADSAGFKIGATHLKHTHRGSFGASAKTKPKPDAPEAEWRTYYDFAGLSKTVFDFERYIDRFPDHAKDIVGHWLAEIKWWARYNDKHAAKLAELGIVVS